MRRRRPSQLEAWPEPFDSAVELDWGDPVISRRLLREHLDQTHDGASRRIRLIDRHVRRLLTLLPPPPARLLDAACGPGLYAVRLGAAGHHVVATDIGPAVVRHAARLAAEAGVGDRVICDRADLRDPLSPAFIGHFDGAVLIYHVLEGFPRGTQARVLRNLACSLRPRGRLIVEMRLRPEHPGGRVSSWDVVPCSLLGDSRHLLLVETVHDGRRNTHVLRETAVFDDGSVAAQQTSSAFTRLEAIPDLFDRAGLAVDRVHDGWSRERASLLSDTCLVIAHRR